MISAGIPGKHVIGYWAKRNNEQLLIESLEDLQKNDLILGAMTQVGRKANTEEKLQMQNLTLIIPFFSHWSLALVAQFSITKFKAASGSSMIKKPNIEVHRFTIRN